MRHSDRRDGGGLEMALWDALGKQLGRPVSDMLGGRTRTRIPVYASFPPRYSNVDQIIKAVGKAVERGGFTMVKLHQRPDESLDAVKAIRGGKFGSDVAIALDLNAAFNSPGKAIKFLNEIHGYEPPRWSRSQPGLPTTRIHCALWPGNRPCRSPLERMSTT